MLPVRLACLVLALFSGEAGAHTTASHAPVWQGQWDLAPWLVGLMLLSAGGYAAGCLRLGRAAGYGGHRQAAWAFAGGWCALAAALVSPLDALGGRLFSAHMLQHEILMIVAAPLLVLGRPLGIWLWAMPPAGRRLVGSISMMGWIRRPWQLMTHPLGAWTLHAAALWAWHAPALFDAALRDNAIHVWQHLSFLLSALLFWWSVLGNDRRSAKRGWAMMSVFSTMLHTGALGVLLTLASEPWYSAYRETQAFGLSPLEDQQLGGLIMWVPAGLVYVAAGLWLLAGWLTRKPWVARAAGPSQVN